MSKINFADDLDMSEEGMKELKKMDAEQKALFISSMREVKQNLGMLGVRAVKLLLQNIKNDVMHIWCEGFKVDLSSQFWGSPAVYNDYETPLTVYEISRTQFEDSFGGMMWIKIKPNYYLTFSFSG